MRVTVSREERIKPASLVGGLLLIVLLMAPGIARGVDPPLRGRSLMEVLDDFRAEGYPLVYSSSLVTEDLVVLQEPDSQDGLAVVAEILQSHGLILNESDGLYLIVRAPGAASAAGSVTAPARASAAIDPSQMLAPAELENLSVSASRYVLFSNSQFFVDQRAIQSLPDLGEDPIRAVHRLPGAAASGLSSRSHFRGGEQNETAIYLNGLQLLDPFHMRDYHCIFSAIDTRAIAGVEAYTGGFPADYGDHMSGVLLLDSARPQEALRTELGFSVYNSSLLNSGHSKGERFDWLLSARRSNLGMFISQDLGEPDYYDLFAELGFELSENTRLSVNALVGKDSVTVITEPDATELEVSLSDSNNRHLWAVVENQWTAELGSRTMLALSELENVRDSSVNDPDQYRGEVLDIRDIDITALRQDWKFKGIENHSLRFGFEVRKLVANFDYRGHAEYQGFFENTLGIESPTDIRVSVAPKGNSYSAYLLDRWQLNERWSLEGGLRWDRQTYTEPVYADQISPRISLLHTRPSGTLLRLSWGRYFQPQAIQDLQVEDGLDSYFAPQRSEHFIAGLQKTFANAYRLRVEGFLKNYARPKPRFENLYDALALIPELEPDRVRLDPESAQVHGVEISLEYRGAGELNGWVSYTWSKATDRIDGHDQLRTWDQRHAIQAGLAWTHGPWELGIAAHVHSGWPVTGMLLGFDEQSEEYFPIVGPRNAEQLNTFATIDFRVSRSIDVGLGHLTVFVEVTNATDRKNICCVDFDIEEDDNGDIFLDQAEDFWLPLIPAAGLLWEF